MTAAETRDALDPRFTNPVTCRLAGFLLGIGLEVEPTVLSQGSFLSGVMISHGTLLVDESTLTYPGDLLHEAGHLALLPAGRRQAMHLDAGADGGYEMAAIAWSYAAALHLGIDPAIVIHGGGYRGGSQAILNNFAGGHTFGVPILEWLGMTADKKKAALLGVPAYPHMLKWVNEETSDAPSR